MKFDDIMEMLNEVETEISGTGDQSFANGNLVGGTGKLPSNSAWAKTVAEVKQAIIKQNLWKEFSSRNVSNLDIVPSTKNKLIITSDTGKRFSYTLGSGVLTPMAKVTQRI